MCTNVESLRCAPGTNIIVYVNYSSIKKEKAVIWGVWKIKDKTLTLNYGLSISEK